MVRGLIDTRGPPVKSPADKAVKHLWGRPGSADRLIFENENAVVDRARVFEAECLQFPSVIEKLQPAADRNGVYHQPQLVDEVVVKQGLDEGGDLVLPGFRRAVFGTPTGMRMWGFVAAGRLDNTIEGDEFGHQLGRNPTNGRSTGRTAGRLGGDFATRRAVEHAPKGEVLAHVLKLMLNPRRHE